MSGDLAIDGGLDPDFVAHASSHCGLGGTYAADPCPPCTSEPIDTYLRCGWNNFGILLWDYNMPRHQGAPRNIYLSGLRITRCSMGLHVLGAQNFTMENSVLEFNGKSTPVADRQKRVKAYCGLPIALYRRQRKRVLSQRLLLARGALGGT